MNQAGRVRGGKRQPGGTKSVASAVSRLVSLKQSAVEHGVPYTSWRELVLREVPHVRIGRSIYLERRDIERWIAAHKETAA